MSVLSRLLAVIAVLASGVIYGTDVFAAIVLRPALTHVDDRTLTSVMGHVHFYGDRRLPGPGTVGLIAAALAALAAALAGRAGAAAAAAAAVLALTAWLVIYRRVSAPVNRELTVAAHAEQTPPDARSLQQRWDSVINARAALQALAVTALCAALALP